MMYEIDVHNVWVSVMNLLKAGPLLLYYFI